MKHDSINGATRFAVKHREACERIADMLGRNLGGEAFFEAEKFLKAEAPDLYDKIGMNLELGEELRTEAEAQAEAAAMAYCREQGWQYQRVNAKQPIYPQIHGSQAE